MFAAVGAEDAAIASGGAGRRKRLTLSDDGDGTGWLSEGDRGSQLLGADPQLAPQKHQVRQRKLKAPSEPLVPEEDATSAQPAEFAAADEKAKEAEQKQQQSPPQEAAQPEQMPLSRPALYTCAPTPLAHFEPVMFGDSHCVALRDALTQGRQLARQGFAAMPTSLMGAMGGDEDGAHSSASLDQSLRLVRALVSMRQGFLDAAVETAERQKEHEAAKADEAKRAAAGTGSGPAQLEAQLPPTGLSRSRTTISHAPNPDMPSKRRVEIRIVFDRIFAVDTLHASFRAEIFMHTRWRVPELDGLSNEELENVDLATFWNPMLYVDNILRCERETRDLSAKNEEGVCWVTERRTVRGNFLQILELHHYPFDVQDLCVMVTSEMGVEDMALVPNTRELAALDPQKFEAAQEWRLYRHVELTPGTVLQEYSSRAPEKPTVTCTVRVARRSGYFYWNVYFITFLVTALGVTTFGPPAEKHALRLELSFTLFLTMIAFKFVINKFIPRISYLTTLDIFVLYSLAMLCIGAVFHTIGAIIGYQQTVSQQRIINTYSLSAMIGVYFVATLVYVIWIIVSVYAKRRMMNRMEREFVAWEKRRHAAGAQSKPARGARVPATTSISKAGVEAGRGGPQGAQSGGSSGGTGKADRRAPSARALRTVPEEDEGVADQDYGTRGRDDEDEDELDDEQQREPSKTPYSVASNIRLKY